MSNTSRYRCSCQSQVIMGIDLKDHIFKNSIHNITKIKNISKVIEYNKKIKQRLNVIKSSKLYLYKKHIMFVFLSQMSIIKSFYHKRYLNTYINIKNFNFTTQINHLLSKQSVKLVTPFKLRKKNFKSGFNKFLSNCTSTFTILLHSNDQNILISGGNDGRIRVFCSKTLKQLYCLGYHRSIIRTLELDSSKKFVLSGADDKLICLWNLEKKSLKTVFKGHDDTITTLNFSENGLYFLSGSEDRTLRLWNILKKSLIFKLTLKSGIRYVEFTEKIEDILFISCDGNITNFNIENSKKKSKNLISIIISCCCYAKKNHIMMVGDFDGFIQLVNIETFRLIDHIRAHSDQVNSIDYCKINRNFFSASRDKTIKMWSESNLVSLRTFDFQVMVHSIQVLEKKIFIAGNLCKIDLYDIETKKSIKESVLNCFPYSNISISVKLELIVYGYQTVWLYSLKSMSNICSRSFKYYINNLAFCGSYILCGNCVGKILILDTDLLRVKKVYNITDGEITYVKASLTFERIAYSAYNKSVIKNFKESKVLMNHDQKIMMGKFKKNKFVFSDSFHWIYIFDSELSELKKIDYYRIYEIYLFKSNDSKYIMMKMIDSTFNLKHSENDQLSKKVDSLKRLRHIAHRKDFIIEKSNSILSDLSITFNIS